MIVTAKDYYEQMINPLKFSDSKLEYKEYAIKCLVEFAKLHVEQAIIEYHKIALQEGLVTEAGIGYFRNAYSLDNIK